MVNYFILLYLDLLFNLSRTLNKTRLTEFQCITKLRYKSQTLDDNETSIKRYCDMIILCDIDYVVNYLRSLSCKYLNVHIMYAKFVTLIQLQTKFYFCWSLQYGMLTFY